MKVLVNLGVLPQSVRTLFFQLRPPSHGSCFSTSPAAATIILNEEYDFRGFCEVGRMESHRTYLLDSCPERGQPHIEADGTTFTTAEARDGWPSGQTAARPHPLLYQRDYTENSGSHIDGSTYG